ncbi:zinc finger, CCHC-type containing protein [Tanacetum coccineum]|uniref:Zinc finger, CCHC-type containing protein n=1 Tax=Tanacetum coccineum TaxID=301880 RepID=A0ABQ4YRV6_9ASTR
MAAAGMKHMASNFAKFDKFKRVDFRRWQKKMHFLLSSMSMVYVLTTRIPEDGENSTVEQLRNRAKWDNDDYDSLEAKYMVDDASSKKFLVSNFTNYKMTDSRPAMKQYNELLDFKHTLKHQKEELTLIDLGSHLRIEESLGVQDNDKPKGNYVAGPSVVNMVEHNNFTRKPGHLIKYCKGGKVGNKANGSGTNGLVDGFTNSLKEATVHVCKDRCWFKTYESLNNGSILHMGNESIALVHGRGCVDLRFSSEKIVSLFNVLHVPNIRKNLVSSSILNNCGYKQVIESNKFVLSKHGVFIGFGYLSNQMFMLNIVNDNIGSAFMSTSKLNDSILWHVRLGHDEALDKFKVFKTEAELQQGSLIKRFRTDRGGERGIECIFVGYAEHSKSFRFYVTEPNEFVSINLIIKSRDAIFDENRFSSVPRPSLRIPNRTEDNGGSVVPKEVTEEVEDNLKTFDEAMKSQDVAFWKEAINDEMNSITGNNTWVLADLPPADKCVYSKFDEISKGVIICLYIDDMLIFGTDQVHVDMTKEFLSSRCFVKDMGEADVILCIRIKHESNGITIYQSHYIEKVLKKFNYFDCSPMSTPMDTSEKLMPNNSQVVSQLEYSRVIGCLMYAMTCIRPDIAFAVGKLSSINHQAANSQKENRISGYEDGALFGLYQTIQSGVYTKWEWSYPSLQYSQDKLSLKDSSVSNTEGLHKGYDRFQSLLSQLEIQKQKAKPGVDHTYFDDLYNNLRVFESDIKGSTASSSSPQNVAFVSENTNNTNEVSTTYCVPNLSGQNTKYEQTSSYSPLANQSSCPQLDHEDLKRELIEYRTLEEMDLKWQNSGNKDGSRTVQERRLPKALVTIDGEGVRLDKSFRRERLLKCLQPLRLRQHS